MSDQSKLCIGKLIASPQFRDAIHVAVTPCVASQKLLPGTHVALDPIGHATTFGKHIGIVDPFLDELVPPGCEFWLFLYPGSITTLRHDWTHPAFVAGAAESVAAETKPRMRKKAAVAAPVAPILDRVSESKAWLMNFAETGADGLGYEELMDAASRYAKHGDYLIQGGRFEGMGIPDEFWTHYEIVTGEVVSDRGSFFSCSC